METFLYGVANKMSLITQWDIFPFLNKQDLEADTPLK